MTYSVAFVGTGDPDADGFAMAYQHADGYERLDECEIVACADLVPENAELFASEHGIDEDHSYEDYGEMLAGVRPDIVSVCVPPAAHAAVAIDCVRSESVRAVHCEKPMALTWKESRDMALEAARHAVQLTFNHQRRFSDEYRGAKELLDAGEIGELRRIETAAPNLFDWGTHCLDIACYFADEAAPEWILGALDYREENRLFGAHNENHGLALWQFENGVFGIASTGGPDAYVDCGFVDALHRLQGTEGVIEVNRRWGNDYPALRIRRYGDDDWEAIRTDDEESDDVTMAIADVVDAIDSDREPELCARNTLNATELVFGAYESVRRRGRVEFPLKIDDNPLEAMVESGDLSPAAPEEP